MRGLRVSLLIGLLISLSSCESGCNPKPRFRKVHTEHLGQLTGTQFNRSHEMGITGTDLGVSLASAAGDHKLIFLFGDSWTLDPRLFNQDSVAWALESPTPGKNKLPRLNWYGGDQFAEITIPNIDLGPAHVPVEGLAINGRYYIFANTEFDGIRHRYSVLAHTEGLSPDFNALIYDWKVETENFINVSAFVDGDTVWIFGSGPYRISDVFLARVPPSQIANRGSWQYFQGMNGNSPKFGPDEATAEPVVVSSCVGELSVRRHPKLGYLMLYNCRLAEGTAPRGIHLRRADNAWGPWDPPINIFDPDADRGYGYFMHRKFSTVGYDDGLAEPET